ncbi:SDR family oxidoreductase [Gluconobacter sphaericus]|uniref:SDR family oxidoreductase n=1 Tax=Gluconobacter sphaericus TaxID=574987 RepID=UPI001B8C311F|nr:SDR family NAD(P)-dependent oxidoreductase [Gluconobacter sphaericus]MBS1087327.1 SDR family NAD(P)-dependent oxidoreductase [Gluconobacter sphaericus]MBS1101391.1 SDR family NAD(P)-dependent oxidoreductase [Gluconobacter sphaericus]
MKLTDNTILITGGGSGIGRALAEAFHQKGNKVIIAGRRRSRLNEVTAANPGMEAIELNLEIPADIQNVAEQIQRDYPSLNVLINNAGIMLPDTADGQIDDNLLISTFTTNFAAPIRLTSALMPHLKAQPQSTIIYNTSGLAFIPLAMTAVYSASKAALHSYVMSQRFLLKDTNIDVIEIAPPWVRTELMNSQEAEAAVPLNKFISDTMALLATEENEIIVDEAKIFRDSSGPQEYGFVESFNQKMRALFQNR